MGGLPRPEVPPGPGRDLVEALHDLHHRAGWPSLRALAREAGCSHTTVSAVFSSPRVPSWGTLELLVEAMAGDTAAFHDLWLAASAPEAVPPPDAGRIAGRRSELVRLRRHLKAGRGLVLVTGEAGIGKTRLVTTAATTADAFVATGSCLPLSTEVPLLPVSDVLRAVHAVDGGHWVKDALTGAAPYVAGSLRHLLPDLGGEAPAPDPDDDWARHRLFTAVGAVLTSLAEQRPFAVLLEDLHWADSATLDLVEHVLTRGLDVPLLGTWRLDDETTPAATTQWWTRVRRLHTVASLPLYPLSREETTVQLELLGRPTDREYVDRIYRRSAGQPLFTEQLAAHADHTGALPEQLADLLDRRLEHLGPEARAVGRVLGVADRALSADVLGSATSLDPAELTSALRELDSVHLLAAPETPHEVELRHPLLAEAFRRHLVPGEGPAVHARVAAALGAGARGSPAEIAGHYRAAGLARDELEWRVRAARAAAAVFAPHQELAEWVRALELWPDGRQATTEPPVTRLEAHLRAIDVSEDRGEAELGGHLIESALALADLAPVERAAVLARSASYESALGDPALAVTRAEEACAIYATLPPSPGQIDALAVQAGALRVRGDQVAARLATSAAVEVARQIGDRHRLRRILSDHAWQEHLAGHPDAVRAAVDEIRTIVPDRLDPRHEVGVAVPLTDLLLIAAADPEQVAATAQPALDLAEKWDLDTSQTAMLRANVAQAWLRAGRVARAAELIDPLTEGPPELRRWAAHLERVDLDVRRGKLEEARSRARQVAELGVTSAVETELVCYAASPDLWQSNPAAALDQLVPAIERCLDGDRSGFIAGPLLLAARACADLVDGSPTSDPSRAAMCERLLGFHSRAADDPFGPAVVGAHRDAAAATWEGELARVSGTATLDHWVTAAAAWDHLGRPHDAAYCRWRAAQAALTEGNRTLAVGLLSRAARDAREHVPLVQALWETAGSSGPGPSAGTGP